MKIYKPTCVILIIQYSVLLFVLGYILQDRMATENNRRYERAVRDSIERHEKMVLEAFRDSLDKAEGPHLIGDFYLGMKKKDYLKALRKQKDFKMNGLRMYVDGALFDKKDKLEWIALFSHTHAKLLYNHCLSEDVDSLFLPNKMQEVIIQEFRCLKRWMTGKYGLCATDEYNNCFNLKKRVWKYGFAHGGGDNVKGEDIRVFVSLQQGGFESKYSLHGYRYINYHIPGRKYEEHFPDCTRYVTYGERGKSTVKEVFKQKPKPKQTYYDYDDDDDYDDYYIQGFDDDVDDTHDMEHFMEEYDVKRR